VVGWPSFCFRGRMATQKQKADERRRFFDWLRQAVGAPRPAEDEVDLRAQSLSMFAADLDAKIATMRAGQHLAVTFRIEVLNADLSGVTEPEARNAPEAHEWRRLVFERDGYRCQECGKAGGLHAHHLKEWAKHPELRFDVDNGVSLCPPCHAKRHPERASLILSKNGRRPKPKAAPA
jgi:hypothetical protein